MEFQKLSFYKNQVAINLLAKDVENAKAVVDALNGHGVVGIISKQFQSLEEGIAYVNKFQEHIPAVSIGLGDGDPNQWKMAAELAAATDPGHVNQIFSAAGYTLGLLKGKGCKHTVVNGLISPTGVPGQVKISTGPLSGQREGAVVPVDTAIAMLKEIGVHSVKFFHMEGNQRLSELKAVAEACVRMEMPLIEPTGGITVENILPILEVCLEAGCQRVMPHVYSAIIDKSTGLTDPQLTKKLYYILQVVIG